MPDPQILVVFLKALIAAKKSLSLYPAGSEMATSWVQRLHRSLHEFFRQGLAFPVRLGRDRFIWADDDVLTIDPVLEAFRFELESRGIAEFSIDSGVEPWELQAFLELLNQPAADFVSIAAAGAHLRAKNVGHISVGARGGGGRQGGAADREPTWGVVQTGKDELDLFVEAVLDVVEEWFTEYTYDRSGLYDWFKAVADDDGPESLYSAIKMMATMAQGGSDREVRTRTVLEAVLMLPDSTLRPLLTKWLIPRAGSDLAAFNLLTQLREDELADIGRLAPEEQLLSLSSELLEFPWEEGKRQQLVDAIATAVQRRKESEATAGETPGLVPGDPLLAELREEIIAACHPDVLLERSTDVLLAIVFDAEGEEYPGYAVDAIEEILGEALARGKLALAVRALSRLGGATRFTDEAAREHTARLALLRRRVGGRTHVSLVAGLLRENVSDAQTTHAADYLRLVGREGAADFTAILADERDRRVRARMCHVLAKLGPPIIPVVRPMLEDSRWYAVRNILYVLGKIGHDSAFPSVIPLLDHPDARVRIEAVRALSLISGVRAAGPLLRYVTDPDPAVRRTVLKALGNLRSDEAVPTLRDLVQSPTSILKDLGNKRDAVQALATIGTPFARATLTQMAARRLWLWKWKARRIRAMARDALRNGPVVTVSVPEADDGP